MSDEVTGTAPEVASPEPTVAETPAVQETAQPFDGGNDAELMAVWEKHNPPRGVDGKFAPRTAVEGQSEPPAAELEGQAPEAAKAEPEIPAIPAPNSWPAEMKAKWDTLPPDAREYIAKRESEAHSQISRMGQQVKALEPVVNVLEQNRSVFERNGLNYQDGINALLRAQVALETNPVAAIQQLAQAYGVDLGSFAGGQTEGSASHQVAALQAQVMNLQRQLQETSSRVMSREQQEAAAQQQALEAQVSDFLKDKNDFEALENEIVSLIPAIRSRNPGMSAKDILAQAYEQAQWLNPEARARKLEADRKAAEAKASEEAKRKATEAKRIGQTNVRSPAPVSGKPRNSDDALKEIALRHYGTL